jgi:hypothetical protein
MMFRPHRRVVLPLVAAYLLATQLAWMAHDHRGHRFGTCCSAPAIATKTHDHDADEHSGPDHHHHTFGHTHRHTCDTVSGCSEKSSRGCGHGSQLPDQPCPLHDDQCSACQFLALAQLTTPVAEFLPQTGEVQTLKALVPPLVVSRIAISHPARGPPVSG